MIDIKEHLAKKLAGALTKLGVPETNFTIERPKETGHGDLSTNAAMTAAGHAKKKPRELASEIIKNLELPDDNISGAEVAGPGFINFFVKEDYYRQCVGSILNKGSEFGRSSVHNGETANIEWVSANPTGPLHAGHGRHIALGKAVASLLEWSGYTVTREYYYNNAGRQMENLARSVYARYRQMFEPGFPMPEDAYAGEYIREIADKVRETYGNKLLQDKEEIGLFKEAGEKWCFDSINRTLRRLGIVHNVFFNEDTLYRDGRIRKILDDFSERGLSYEKDGAVFLKTTELIKDRKDHEDKVIVKSTGEPTYRLPDMAYHIDKIERGFDIVVDIFGADHADTYKEVLAGVKALGHDTSKVKVIIHQMVTFVQEGQPVKMSKRSGNVYYLDDLLDDVGADVAQFFFVMRSANTHLDFDIALAKEQSEKNPVFYLQYAYARISGILRNAAEVFPAYMDEASDLSLLSEPEEISLCKALSFFPEVVLAAAQAYEPHKIINYLNEAAENYHKFYHNHRVINAEDKERSLARLNLCEAARIVLKNGFDIIGISAPERM